MNRESFFFDPQSQGPLTEESAKQQTHRDELFKLLVSSVRDYAIFMLDPAGKIITWNEGAERAKGYRADEIIGKHFSIFYPAEARASNHPQHELEIAKKNGRYEEEGWRVRKDGSVFWASVVITALVQDNKLIGFAKVTRDLTERKRAEEEKEANAFLLQETNDELQRLAYIVSHELQGPIAAIGRYSNLLNVRYKDRLGEDANEFIEKITHSTKLIGRMIDDLWTYARVGSPGTAQEAVSLNNALSEAIEELKELIGQSKLTFPRDMPTVRGNRRQLVYLFKELIANAIKHRGPETPTIQLSWRQETDGFLVSCTDNGLGIDKVYGGEIFKLFHRVRGPAEAGGTGIGLAVCKKIVQHHNGRMWFDSEPGQGTTFHVWFPASIVS